MFFTTLRDKIPSWDKEKKLVQYEYLLLSVEGRAAYLPVIKDNPLREISDLAQKQLSMNSLQTLSLKVDWRKKKLDICSLC